MLAEKLGLTEEQKTKMKELREETRSQAKAIKENEALTAEEKAAQLKTLRESRKAKVAEILTPEQLEKLQEMRDNWKNKKCGGKGKKSSN